MSLYKIILTEAISQKKEEKIKNIIEELYLNRLRKLNTYINAENKKEAEKNIRNFIKEHFDINNFYNSMKDADPSKKGIYLNWIILRYLLPIVENNANLTIIENKFNEDYYKLKDYLQLFHENKADLKRRDQHTDINQYKSIQELFQVVRPYRSGGKLEEPEDTIDLIENRYYIEQREATLVVDDDDYLVVVPHTEEASKFYTCNTEWCTAYPNSFESYNRDGTLFIFINKKDIINNTINSNSLIQSYFRDDGEFIETRDSNDQLYNGFKKLILKYEEEIADNLEKDDNHTYKANPNKIPMRNAMYHLEKFDGQWYVTFDDWEDLADLVGGYEDFAKTLLRGDYFELFNTDYVPELSDVFNSYDLEENGMKALRELVEKEVGEHFEDKKLKDIKNEIKRFKNLKDYEDFLDEFEEKYDEDPDIYFEEINNALRYSLQRAQENADGSKAYKSIIDHIMDELNVSSDTKVEFKNNKYMIKYPYDELKSSPLIKVINIFRLDQNGSEEDEEESITEFAMPYYGFQGSVDDELFTKSFINYVDLM